MQSPLRQRDAPGCAAGRGLGEKRSGWKAGGLPGQVTVTRVSVYAPLGPPAYLGCFPRLCTWVQEAEYRWHPDFLRLGLQLASVGWGQELWLQDEVGGGEFVEPEKPLQMPPPLQGSSVSGSPCDEKSCAWISKICMKIKV